MPGRVQSPRACVFFWTFNLTRLTATDDPDSGLRSREKDGLDICNPQSQGPLHELDVLPRHPLRPHQPRNMCLLPGG